MPRRNRNPVPIAETKSEFDIQELVNAAVAKEIAKSEGRTVTPYHCRSCYRLTDNDAHDSVCKVCLAAGFLPSLLHYTAGKMGFVTGTPSDLIEVLSKTLTEEQIWDGSPDFLASVWDTNTVALAPTSVKEVGTTMNGYYSALLVEFGDYLPTPPRHRPPTPQERDEQSRIAAEQIAADTSRRAAAGLRAARQTVEDAKKALAELEGE